MTNDTQLKLVEDKLLTCGYVSRNEMYEHYISRLSSIIQILRSKYVIDTLQFKSKNAIDHESWGGCIYILKRSFDKKIINHNYDKILKDFREKNTLKNDKFFTNDIQNR